MGRVKIVSIILIIAFIAGCSNVDYSVNRIEITSDGWSGNKEEEMSLNEGDTLEFSIDCSHDDGELSITIYDSAEDVIYSLDLNESKVIFEIPESGDYKIEVIGDKFNGELVLSWTVEA